MPCRDYFDDHPEAFYKPQLADKDAEIALLKKRIAFAESALCGVLRASDAQESDSFKFGHLWSYIDFEDAGITSEELETWRVQHEAADAQARTAAAAAEAKRKKEAKLKAEAEDAAQALQKTLSPEALKLLRGLL